MEVERTGIYMTRKGIETGKREAEVEAETGEGANPPGVCAGDQPGCKASRHQAPIVDWTNTDAKREEGVDCVGHLNRSRIMSRTTTMAVVVREGLSF